MPAIAGMVEAGMPANKSNVSNSRDSCNSRSATSRRDRSNRGTSETATAPRKWATAE